MHKAKFVVQPETKIFREAIHGATPSNLQTHFDENRPGFYLFIELYT